MAKTSLSAPLAATDGAARKMTRADLMKSRAHDSLVRMLRILTLLWLGFILILLALDMVFVTYRPEGRLWPASYYLLNCAVPLLILGLSLVPRLAAQSRQLLLPLAIIALAVAPLVITTLSLAQPAPGPLSLATGTLNVRTSPILLLGLTLVAWQYQWRHVVCYILGTGLVAVLCLVLTGNGRSAGMPFTVGQVIVFMALGYSMCMIMGRLRAQSQALEQANTQLRRHASTLESLTISRERNRLARELHDTLAHRLSALAVQLETTKAYLRVDMDVVQELVETALASARCGLDETRRALNALRASPLDDLGLALALRELATSAAEAALLKLELAIAEQLPELEPDLEQCVYRVAQEALANVAHHAGATRVCVRLSCAGDRLQLAVQDDGIGFLLAQPALRGHYGLPGMYERAALAGGRLAITSAPGQGTTVELELAL